MSWRGVIEEFREFLPVTPATPVVTLLEGNTPLIPAPALGRFLGGDRQVFLKFEGLNPTGSFKDRGMTVALSLAVGRGATTVICASTGNTSAAAAAYASRAGVACVVLLPDKKIAKGKLAQALMYGAKVVAIRGNFDDALRLVRELGSQPGFAVVNSINPDRIEGQKTASFEIIHTLGDAPQVHILPVGNAGNITAYWKGYREFHALNRSTRLPKMIGAQAAGAAPLVLGHVVPDPKTIATAISIGDPASADGARAALQESGGCIHAVTDEEILAAQFWLSSREGVFVEPASAASVALAMKIKTFGCLDQCLPPGATIVCTVTGHGLKDPDIAIEHAPGFLTADADRGAVLKALGA